MNHREIKGPMQFTVIPVLSAIFILSVLLTIDECPTSSKANRVAQHAASEADSSAEKPTFVGKQVCKECHSENFQLHSSHGHASTFHVLSETSIPDELNGKSFDGGADYGIFQYSRKDDGTLVVTSSAVPNETVHPLQYVLGSGIQAQTFLTMMDRELSVLHAVEHRGSLYPGGKLGVTPGHDQSKPTNQTEHFGEVVTGEPLDRCIYCHTTAGQPRKGTVAGLIANVNCEKCHGPGSTHVAQARSMERPPPFSVGKQTWDTESEIQLCGDCHRMPRNVTEKELREYPDLLVRFQPIGMLRSECYLKSGRQLKCTTCHNPHQSVSQESTHLHEQNCIRCHQESEPQHTLCPIDTQSGCIECHMPSVELSHGLVFHDHWIRVQKEKLPDRHEDDRGALD